MALRLLFSDTISSIARRLCHAVSSLGCTGAPDIVLVEYSGFRAIGTISGPSSKGDVGTLLESCMCTNESGCGMPPWRWWCDCRSAAEAGRIASWCWRHRRRRRRQTSRPLCPWWHNCRRCHNAGHSLVCTLRFPRQHGIERRWQHSLGERHTPMPPSTVPAALCSSIEVKHVDSKNHGKEAR